MAIKKKLAIWELWWWWWSWWQWWWWPWRCQQWWWWLQPRFPLSRSLQALRSTEVTSTGDNYDYFIFALLIIFWYFIITLLIILIISLSFIWLCWLFHYHPSDYLHDYQNLFRFDHGDFHEQLTSLIMMSCSAHTAKSLQ